MALQPDIALNAGRDITQYDPVGSLGKAVSLKNLMLGQQKAETDLKFQAPLLQAKLDADQAAAEQAKRELAGKKAYNALFAKHTTTDTKSGKPITDFTSLAAEASSMEGVDPGTIAELQQKSFNAAQSGNTAAQGAVKTKADAMDFAQKHLGITDNIVRSAPTNLAAFQAAESTKKNLHASLDDVIGPDAVNEMFVQRYGMPPPNPNGAPPTPDQLGSYLKGRAQQVATATTVSPQQAIANAQTEESLRQGREGQAQSGAANVAGPDARNPTSAVSRQAQQDYLAANPTANRAEVIRLSAADIQHLSGTSGLVASSIPSAGDRAGAKVGAAAITGDVDIIKSALGSMPKLQQTYGTKLGGMAQDAYNRLVTQDPALGQLDAAVQAYNQRNGTNVDVRTDGFAAVQARLAGEAARLGKVATAKSEIATSPTLTSTPKAAPAADAPMRKMGDIIKRNGKTYVYTGKTSALGSADTKNPANYKEQK
jgi:hypothetical protein